MGRRRLNEPEPAPLRIDPDPDDGATVDNLEVEVRFLQPHQATKSYVCPGCGREIPARTGHVVAVPREAPDLRRHWHRGCWDARHRRRVRD